MDYADQRRFAGTDARLVEDVLAEYGKLTQSHLQTYLPKAEPRSME